MDTRLNIFCGHYGSGKTEVALNFAMKLREKGKKVIIVDMDTVNPYFRTADARNILKDKGIEMIASEFANTNLDIPTLPQEIKRVFYDKESYVIFDVGGDDDGAYALGQFKNFFSEEEYRMFFVVNTKRPLTGKAEEIYDMARNIERASRLQFTDIANNTNVGGETGSNTLFSDYAELEELSKRMSVPITLQCGTKKALEAIPKEYDDNKFFMKIYIKMPWEQ